MTNEVISIGSCQLSLTKDFITNEAQVQDFVNQLDELGNTVLDLSTMEEIKSAKKISTSANQFIARLKEYCEPMELEGKRISSARSLISTKIDNKSKKSVVVKLLAPIKERESMIKSIRQKISSPSINAADNAARLEEVEKLLSFDWLGYKDEIMPDINATLNFLKNEKEVFAKIEEGRIAAEKLAEIEREKKMQIEVERRAKIIAEQQVASKKEAPISTTVKVDEKPTEESTQSADKNKKKLVHRDIIKDLLFHDLVTCEDKAKQLITLIYNKEIKNLSINY